MAPDLDVLDHIQRRVLWLATRMVHEANHVRPNPDSTKVGGHQASSASVVSIMTALYFGGWLHAGDRVSVKPHASPVLHAIQYLLGNLDRRYLTQLRAFGGLQAYPSRTKDPDPVDFSTGSVGLGAAAPLFAALADRYAAAHFHPDQAHPTRRFIGIVGDAELDEGNVWEAIGDETIRGTRLGNVLWIVDLNRQSLDRVIPGIKVQEMEALFRGIGWQVIEAKYGRRLQSAFKQNGGIALRRRIDDMPNEEYQELVRLDGAAARARLIDSAPSTDRENLEQCLRDTSDSDLPHLLSDLGGHDLAELLDAFSRADRTPGQPTVLFAYTMKGWGLPFAGDPLNHSALLTEPQIAGLRQELCVPPDDEWACFSEETPEGALCRETAARLYPRGARPPVDAPPVRVSDVPDSLGSRVPATVATQEVFGNALVELARMGGPLAERIVTASPDVTISTNLGGWVNRTGVWAENPWQAPATAVPRLLRWEPGPSGQHIELGISEMNLFMLLGQLGLSHEVNGELLLPVGTVYDPFVCRGLDALIYSVYSGAKFIFAGTPAGVTLSPEGGAHQSAVTASLGMELPNVRAYEPCFARETEWAVLEALRQCLDRENGMSTYLRLSTRAIAQAPFDAALSRLGEAALREHVLRGGYRLLEPDPDLVASGAPRVVLAACGPIVPDVLDAAAELSSEGVAATVLNITSGDRLYAEWQTSRLCAVRSSTAPPTAGHLGTLILAEERRAPLVTVLDGASHALAFLGSVFGQPTVPLGMDRFGQSGGRADLYGYAGIDAGHVVNAALLALAAEA
ncbi:MAG: pyruvate dehydrogenase [Chloroflexi bacterium]|nr:pyruvate dehydrogenase [Chloroflexota bacterium]